MAEAHANLANALQQIGNFDLALIYYQVLCWLRKEPLRKGPTVSVQHVFASPLQHVHAVHVGQNWETAQGLAIRTSAACAHQQSAFIESKGSENSTCRDVPVFTVHAVSVLDQ